MFTVVTSSPKSFTEILFSPGASADDILDTDGDLDVSGNILDVSDGDQDRDVGEVVAIVADEEWSSDDFELSSDSLQLDDTHHIEAFYDSDTLPFTVYDGYRSPEAISEVVTTSRGSLPANLDVSMRSDDENLAAEDGGEEDSGEVWLDVDDTENASEESEESTSREVDDTVTVSSESSDESSEPEYTDTSSSDEDEVIDVEIISTDESDSAVVDDTYLINDDEEEEDDEDHNQDVVYEERYYEWERDSHYPSRVGAQPAAASSSSSSEGDGDGATSDERERVDYVRRPSSDAISTSGDETARRELPAVAVATAASQSVAAATATSQVVATATEATALDVASPDGVASTSTGGPGAPSVTASPVGGAARSPAKCDASPNRKRQRVDEDPDVGRHSRLVFYNK